MIKTIIYKLYKNKKNKNINQKIDIAGIIYNHCIALNKTYYRIFGKSLNKYRLQKHLTKIKKLKKNSFWNLLGSQAIQDITDRIDRAYKLFFQNQKKRVRPPSFKKVKKYKSFTLKQAGYEFLEDNRVRIGSQIIKYSKSRSFEGNIKTVTLKRDMLGDLYVIIVIDIKEEATEKVMTGKIAGFDFGLKIFLTSSNGEEQQSPLFYKKSSKQIVECNKILSRKKEGSNRRKKARYQLAKIYKFLVNHRKNYFFHLARDLVKRYDYLFLEDLNIKAMQRLWGKKISDLAFYSFIKILKHMANKYGKTIHQIDRFYPSSKTCSNCERINHNLKLKDRFWTCPHCLKELNREVNAAINILREGASSPGLCGDKPALRDGDLGFQNPATLLAGVCQ